MMLRYYISAPGSDQPEQASNTALTVSAGLLRPIGRATSRPDRAFAITLVWSLVAHAALAAAFLFQASSQSAGSGDADLDVVSVTIVSSAALRSATGAGVVATNAVKETVSEAPSPPSPHVATSDPVEMPPTPPPELVLPPSQLDAAELQSPPVIETEPVEVERKDPPRDPDPPASRREQAAQPSQLASVPSAPTSIGGSTEGQASASKGDIERYAREVALVLARHRTNGDGTTGRVTVEFTLSVVDGSIEQSRVIKPSGSAKLDALALAVIDRGTYPRPPKGMTTAQLTFRVPFSFK